MTLEKFLLDLKDIFETTKINKNQKITSLKNWDSLTALSVLALIDSNFKNIKINASKIEKFKSIEELYKHVSKK
jgi:acyl carrier protein